MSENKCIILDGFVNVGDRVVIHSIPDYNRHPNLPVGTVLICKGHIQWHDNIDFGDIRKDRPRGRYLKFGAALYEVANAETDFPQYRDLYLTYSAHNLIFEDQTLDPQKTRRDTFEWKMNHEGVKVADLPETDFVVGDIVDFIEDVTADPRDRYRPSDKNFRHAVIQSVTYGRRDNPNIQYDVGVYFERENGEIARGYSYPYVNGKHLVLKERGNFYHHLHDPSKIAFKDLADEASFYAMLGEREDVRNPRNGLYMWTRDEALLYIREGKAAGLRIESGIFGSGPQLHVYSFPTQPEFETRLRQAIADGFAEQYAELDAGKEVELSPLHDEWLADLERKRAERKAKAEAEVG